MANPIVGLAMPFRNQGGTDHEATCYGVARKATDGKLDVMPCMAWTSLLPFTFNILWTGCLNRRGSHGLQYFAMIHDDVKPSAGWLDTLIGELLKTGADMVSAVIPIKNNKGLTSTGVDDTGDQWNPRRLTLAECFNVGMPTFGDKEAGGPILLNTGCWVIRLDRPWVDSLYFEQRDRVIRTNGTLVPETASEDWNFSRQVRAHGGVLKATLAVEIEHERAEWHNRSPWGLWDRDEDWEQQKQRMQQAVADPTPAG